MIIYFFNFMVIHLRAQSVPLTTSRLVIFFTGQVKRYQSLARRDSKNFVLQNLNFQISSHLQWKTTQHFKRVILFIPFWSSELRFVIRDFTFSLYASGESRFYIMHIYSNLQLEGFLNVIFMTHKRIESSDFHAHTNNRNRGTYKEINFYINYNYF
jgi:hypothetical protein